MNEPLPESCPICERPNYYPSDHHMIPRSRGGKSTETICRDCHKAIHACFSNKELEEKYNTPEMLLTNEVFAKMDNLYRFYGTKLCVVMPIIKKLACGTNGVGALCNIDDLVSAVQIRINAL